MGTETNQHLGNQKSCQNNHSQYSPGSPKYQFKTFTWKKYIQVKKQIRDERLSLRIDKLEEDYNIPNQSFAMLHSKLIL